MELRQYDRYAQVQGISVPQVIYTRTQNYDVSIIEDVELVVAFTTAGAVSLRNGEGGPAIFTFGVDTTTDQHFFQWTGLYVMYPGESLFLDFTFTGGPGSVDGSVSGHSEPYPGPAPWGPLNS